MTAWQDRVDAVWQDGTLTDAERIARVDALAAERSAVDADALFERAGARDSAGEEAAAEPLYRAALAAGLSGSRRTQALIQLASTLRNLGRPEEALEVLREADDMDDGSLAPSIAAFRALALFSAGEDAAAVRTALRALAPTLPRYARAVGAYADELDRP